MGRHILPGLLKAYWLTAAPADLDAPTQAELTAGVDLIGTKGGEALADINGFKPSNSVYDTPDYVDAIVGNVGGTSTYPQSSMMFYSDTDSSTIRDALAQGDDGYIVIGWLGSAATDESQVFSASVLSNEIDPSKSQATIYEVAFGISAPTKGAFVA